MSAHPVLFTKLIGRGGKQRRYLKHTFYSSFSTVHEFPL